MYRIAFRAAVATAALSLGGCFGVEHLKTAAVEAAEIQQVCTGMAVSPEEQRATDRRAVADMVARLLLLPPQAETDSWRGNLRAVRDLVEQVFRGDPATLKTLVPESERNKADAFYREVATEIRRRVTPVVADIEAIEARYRSLRDLVDRVSTEGRALYRQAATGIGQPANQLALRPGNAAGTVAFQYAVAGTQTAFEPLPILRAISLVYVAAAEIDSDARAMGIALLKLKDDIEAFRQLKPLQAAGDAGRIAEDAAIAILKSLAARPELAKLETSATAFLAYLRDLADVVDGKKFLQIGKTLYDEFKEDLDKRIKREAGRFAIDMMHRAARSIEDRLDDLPTDQFIALSVVSFAVSEVVSAAVRDAAEKMAKADGKWDSFDDVVLSGLALGSCARLSSIRDDAAPDAFRADQLLRPAYKGIVAAYACKNDPMIAGAGLALCSSPDGKQAKTEVKDVRQSAIYQSLRNPASGSYLYSARAMRFQGLKPDASAAPTVSLGPNPGFEVTGTLKGVQIVAPSL